MHVRVARGKTRSAAIATLQVLAKVTSGSGTSTWCFLHLVHIFAMPSKHWTYEYYESLFGIGDSQYYYIILLIRAYGALLHHIWLSVRRAVYQDGALLYDMPSNVRL